MTERMCMSIGRAFDKAISKWEPKTRLHNKGLEEQKESEENEEEEDIPEEEKTVEQQRKQVDSGYKAQEGSRSFAGGGEGGGTLACDNGRGGYGGEKTRVRNGGDERLTESRGRQGTRDGERGSAREESRRNFERGGANGASSDGGPSVTAGGLSGGGLNLLADGGGELGGGHGCDDIGGGRAGRVAGDGAWWRPINNCRLKLENRALEKEKNNLEACSTSKFQ